MQITEEQRKRAEANRLAALARRQAKEKLQLQAQGNGPWGLFRCQKIINADPRAQTNSNFNTVSVKLPVLIVTLEMCSPRAFSVSTERATDSSPTTAQECFHSLRARLSAVNQLQSTEVEAMDRLIYSVSDYDAVIKILKHLQFIQVRPIPLSTLVALQRFAISDNKECKSNASMYIADAEVDKILEKLPSKLKNELLPFQLEGVKFGIHRGGRCLLADEMGVGKTVQAIAIASCYMKEGPLLIVCPASMRFTWADELERWLPFCPPREIHLVFGRRDNPFGMPKCPKIVVISYTMLSRLRKDMLTLPWGFIIVDESHNLRCTKKPKECDETQAVLDLAKTVEHVVLLSGTPSLSRPYDIFHQIDVVRPGLLGKDKYEFARNYCSVQFVQLQGKSYKDYSKGIRLQELNILLKETVMIRRMKENVLSQLPPKRRQVIRVLLTPQDISFAKKIVSEGDARTDDSFCKCGFSSKGSCDCEENDSDDLSNEPDESEDHQGFDGLKQSPKALSYQEIGVAKLRSFQEWFSNHDVCINSENSTCVEESLGLKKMVIFAHHIRVLDGIQEIVCQHELEFVRIDGSTVSRDRQAAVQAFRSKPEVKIAIIGITAGGVGLDFSAAQSVAFAEIPKTASEMMQAEDRVHRRGLKSAINIYCFCAKDTSDESHWKQLNKSFERITTMMNGIACSINDIEVSSVSNLHLLPNSKANTNAEIDDKGLHMTSRENDCQGPADGVAADVYKKNDSAEAGIQNSECDENENDCRKCQELSFDAEDASILDRMSEEYIFGDVSLKYQEFITNGDQQKVLEKFGRPFLSSRKVSSENRLISTVTNDHDSNKPALCQGLSAVDAGSSHISNLQEQKVHDYGVSSESEQFSTKVMESDQTGLESDSPLHSLLFEVSANTGRVHLYTYDFGEEFRPRKLELNFQPEEVESPCKSEGFLSSPSQWKSIIAFMDEWNRLRPIDRNKLYGRPLRLPLCLELDCIKSDAHYTSAGTLKGGSKRRVAPRDEIADALPENASWRKICLYKNHKTKERHEMQACSAEGQPLCKLCLNPCFGVRANVPEYFEDLFCKFSCFEEYRMRTSQRYLREALFSIEHGICTQCKLDCHKLVKCIRPLPIEQRRTRILKAAPNFMEHENLLNKLVREPHEGNAWHADHIIPVYKGGGECKVENMRTLCVVCHAKVTAQQQQDRRQSRARAKDALQLTIEKFIERVCQKRMKLCTQISPIKEDDDKDLLMEVAGSAYSGKPDNLEYLPSK